MSPPLLLRAALLCGAGVAHAPGCPDPAATNYDPATPATASAYNNSGCAYTCANICSHFALPCLPARTLCLIDGAVSSHVICRYLRCMRIF